ncbi:MAG: YegS/Rv2252/BmrU family lipid kinase [Butyricicoccus sp.]|nr:YegS/Rv2252/BmrU family lipid kinase [Butyricicoccus sp.]
MKKQKLLFVINPNAGKGEIRQHALACVDQFVRAGYQVEVYTTQKQRDAADIVKERAGEFDRIVCSGGDGTLNEMISGIMEGGHQTTLGYIPAGTVNDFATSLGIPKLPPQAAALCVSGEPFTVDIGRFGDRYFNYIAAFGAFTEVSYQTSQEIKNLLGRVAYLLQGVKELPQIKPIPMTVAAGDRVLEGEFIYGMVSNTTTVGGFKGLTANDVQMDDGLFEVMLVRLPKNVAEWQQALTELSQPETDWNFIIRFSTDKLRFVSQEPVPWTLDGEFGGMQTEVNVETIHPGIRILVPGI